MIKFFLSFSILLLLTSCVSNKGKNNAAGDTLNKTAITDTMPLTGEWYYEFIGDSVLIKPFTINLNLSPKAAATLTDNKETVIINVSFTATPKDSTKINLEEDGSFYVASFDKEIKYSQPAIFDDIRFPKKIYDQLADKNIEAAVNVSSGRKSSPDNLLNCDFLSDKLSNIAGKNFTIKGRLIYGDD